MKKEEARQKLKEILEEPILNSVIAGVMSCAPFGDWGYDKGTSEGRNMSDEMDRLYCKFRAKGFSSEETGAIVAMYGESLIKL